MQLEWGAARAQGPTGALPFKNWLQPDGTPCANFYRVAGGYLVRFPDVGDFEIRADGAAATCRPMHEAERETCLHLYLNQVLPLMLTLRGELVLHGSAVEIDGCAAAFVAESGRGKSTLAASFATSGHRFLSDDGLAVTPTEGGFLARPSHPSIRLYRDSETALIGGTPHPASPVHYTSKTRLLAGNEMIFCEEPLTLRGIFFLGDGHAPSLTLERMRASDAMTAFMRNSFLLEPDERIALAAYFDRLAMLANGLPCFRLDYPRRFEELPRVRHAVVEQCRMAA